MKRIVLVGLLATTAVAGCSSSSSGGAAPHATVTETVTTTATPTVTATTTPVSDAENLFLTDDIRHQLIHAQALVVRVPDSAFVRLAPGTAYYAVDHDTGTYWAGASLIPSRHSLRAQVSVQDDGGYLLFEKKPGSDWVVYDVGLEGQPDSTACPIHPPLAVLAIWHWKPDACNPPGVY